MTRSHKPFDTEARLLTIYNLSVGGDVGVLDCGPQLGERQTRTIITFNSSYNDITKYIHGIKILGSRRQPCIY